MSKIIQAVKAHVPLIKFPKRVKWEPSLDFNPAKLTPKIKLPTRTSAPIGNLPDTIEVFRVVPDRFRRRPVDVYELEYIERGGPE